MLSPSDEPTAVLRLFGDFSNRIQSVSTGNRSRSTSGLPASSSSSVQQRLKFDDSVFFRTPAGNDDNSRRMMKRTVSHSSALTSALASAATRNKLSRLDSFGEYEVTPPPNFSSTSSDRKRYPSCEDYESLKMELEKVKMDLVAKEAECLEAETAAKKSQDSIMKMEFSIRKERIEQEELLQKARRETRQLLDRTRDLEEKLSDLKNRSRHEREDDLDSRRLSIENRHKLQDRCAELTEENCHLQEELAEMQRELQSYQDDGGEKVLDLKQELVLVRSQLEESKARQELAERQSAKTEQAKKEAESLRIELDRTKTELSRLNDEVRANAEATLQRKALQSQLTRYPQLIEENETLRRENQLLIETAENSQVLKEQVESLQQDLTKARYEAAQGDKAKQDLVHASKRIRQWETACLQLLTPQERLAIGENSVGIEMFMQKVAHCQQDRLMCTEEINSLKARIFEDASKFAQFESQIESLTNKLKSEKDNLAESANLVRRLKRKLLLVSKERDSYKGVLDSYEHELTITGSQFDQDRAGALAKIIEDHKSIIEDLEQQLLAAKSGFGSGASGHDNSTLFGSSEVGKLKADLNLLQEKVRKVENERDELRYEMDRRAMRGDYNPSDTKVIHFRNNPLSQAKEELDVNLGRLQQENEALKTRIRLLEEGQTKDLTILVGHKLEEGTSEQEVNELRDKLKSAETARQRLIEAFKKTSQEFREACSQITGYKIDGLPNQQYRLSPIYAESPHDHLIFRRDSDGECHVLETAFLSQLKDLTDLHLRRQNSIPVFCAAVIMELFSRQTFDTVATTEEEDNAEEEEEEEDQEEEEEAEEEGDEGGAGDDDDPICID